MLQRVQTIYFSLVIICLGVTCTGMEFFRFVKGTEFYSFSVYGIQKGMGNDLSMHKSIPIFSYGDRTLFICFYDIDEL